MQYSYILYFIIFFTLYFFLNYYLGKTIFKGFNTFIKIPSKIFWIIFWTLSLSYIVSMILNKYLPYSFGNLLSLIGSYWLFLLMFTLLTFPILGIANFILRKASVSSNKIYKIETLSMILIFMILFIIGNYYAKNSYVKSYDINIEKIGIEDSLNIVMVSDIHLGNIVKIDRLKSMVKEINKLNPDLIIIAGDIIDSDFEPFIEHNMAEEFSNLKSTYGTFATLGNHDIFTREEDKIVHILNENSVNVLRDEVTLIDDKFYIIGRDDITVNSFNNYFRADLNELTKDLDKLKPLIVIDHNPKYINESLKADIDLHLSGHTHKGQIIPANLVTNKLFEVDYGYLKKDNLNVVVSSGYGTWGPSLRLGSRSEIVQINLQ